MTTTEKPIGSGDPLLFIVFACVTYLALGMIVAGIGPSFSTLASNTGSSISDVSAILSMLFAGGVVGQLAAGWLMKRFSVRVLTFAFMIAVATCVFGFTLTHALPLAMAFSFVCGLCDGPMGIILNLTLALVYGDRASKRIGLASTFFGIGSVLCPALISLAINAGSTPLIGLWGGAALVLLAAFPLAVTIDTRPYQHRGDATNTHSLPVRVNLLNMPLFWVSALFLLVYVGIEQGTGAWATRYVSLTTPYSEATGAQLSAAYWLAFTLSRFLVGLLGTRTTPLRFLTFSLSGALIGGGLLLIGGGNLIITGAGTLIIGFCFGPTFPVFFPVTTRWFAGNAAQAAGIINACGSLGALLLNSVQGYVIERIDPAYNPLYTIGVLVLLIGIYRLAVSLSRLRVRGSRDNPLPSAALTAPTGTPYP
jgi:fucose permease